MSYDPLAGGEEPVTGRSWGELADEQAEAEEAAKGRSCHSCGGKVAYIGHQSGDRWYVCQSCETEQVEGDLRDAPCFTYRVRWTYMTDDAHSPDEAREWAEEWIANGAEPEVDIPTAPTEQGLATYDPLTDFDGQAHVLLDALAYLEDAMREGSEPWADFDCGRDEGPIVGDLGDKGTYLCLFAAAVAHANATLDGSDPMTNYTAALAVVEGD